MAKILLVGHRHITTPNTPRHSQHTLIRSKSFPFERLPLEKIWSPLQSVATWRANQEYQLIHAFNGIPYTNKPWIVTFEYNLPHFLPSVDPRIAQFKNILKHRLASENCKSIIAMSDFAKSNFVNELKNWDLFNQVVSKLKVIPPNFPVKASQPKKYNEDEGFLELLFVGNDFARKGGIVALRLAEKAKKLGIPVRTHIVSNLTLGHKMTDFPDITRYQKDLKLLDLSNVIFHGALPNKKLFDLFSKAHFQILATLADTYGYSILEGFSVATPAITTNICALPEFVHHGQNGYLLNLELSENRLWNHFQNRSQRKSQEYWDIVDNTYDQLADQALQLLVEFLDRPDRAEQYEFLSEGALTQVRNFHDSRKANELFDHLYSEILSETT